MNTTYEEQHKISSSAQADVNSIKKKINDILEILFREVDLKVPYGIREHKLRTYAFLEKIEKDLNCKKGTARLKLIL